VICDSRLILPLEFTFLSCDVHPPRPPPDTEQTQESMRKPAAARTRGAAHRQCRGSGSRVVPGPMAMPLRILSSIEPSRGGRVPRPAPGPHGPGRPCPAASARPGGDGLRAHACGVAARPGPRQAGSVPCRVWCVRSHQHQPVHQSSPKEHMAAVCSTHSLPDCHSLDDTRTCRHCLLTRRGICCTC
jgi:hypothetical protein